jgi:hypothetical protein
LHADKCNFYGIPKIHKKPVGFRPIILCHSVIFNPAAKFISKELKPIIKSCPTIIHGAKEFLYQLSHLSIDSGKKWFFITRDVVAFYLNIPLHQCLRIVSTIYADWTLQVTGKPDTFEHKQDLLKLKIFECAIEIGNTSLITLHAGRYFLQLNRLAMGVADSSDLSNLFGAHFELSEQQMLSSNSVAFYGRYIDDCFGIVYANSENDALMLLCNSIIV